MNRKSAPRVKRGRVQKKNNAALTPNYYTAAAPFPVIDRLRPGKGFRHLLTHRDVETFIELLPEWDDLATGLNAIVLAPGGDDMGWHEPGVIHICAWEAALWWDDTTPEFVQDHRAFLDRLGVKVVRDGDRLVTQWTESQARAFQLLHIFLHELGHHHDRMTTRSRARAARGEQFAEQYARRNESAIWEAYVGTFGL